MTSPLVALDGREFVPGRQTGIGRYLGALVERVRQTPPAWTLQLVGPPGMPSGDGLRACTVGAHDGWAWDWVHLPRHLRRTGARAYVTPYVKFRPTPTCPVVAVICDPTDLVPESGPRHAVTRRLLRALRRRLARRAAARVTISAWSQQEIARVLALPSASFRVIRPGVARPVGPLRSASPGGYVFHLSNGKPHKNVVRLIDAYAALPATLRSAHPLVLAGLHPAYRETAARALGRHHLAGTARLLGHVAEAALPEMYAGAAAFAFPSLAEGFGIPPLEAMAWGVPVVASTAGALPETLGDAAVLVDPRDGRALRDALAAVLADRQLREQLIARGRARVEEFPPERTGTALAEVVGEVIAREGSAR